MNSGIEVTVLADNRAEAPFLAEHGLALWIEAGNKKFLMDTGQGISLCANAALMNIDISKTDSLILSHGHYDHTGSVADVLRLAPQADIYLHPAAFLPRYSLSGGEARPVQAPGTAMSSIVAHPERKVHWIHGYTTAAAVINLTGPIPRETEFEDTGGPFFLDPGGKNPDPIRDDLALWLDTDEGLVVCTGCCHSGIINTLRYIIRITGRSRVKRVIGGLHLVNASQERLERTVEELNKLQIEELVPCHCTGDKAVEYLSAKLDFPVTQGYVGMKI
jgi:7,8-dihydropterin-6-yl-methyl-4-(beta-D-ribofuranosyl)aminobenzene 5'-phosphate synthase